MKKFYGKDYYAGSGIEVGRYMEFPCDDTTYLGTKLIVGKNSSSRIFSQLELDLPVIGKKPAVGLRIGRKF